MRRYIEKRVQRIEDKLNPKGDWNNIFVRWEYEPMPEHDPDKDRVITICPRDMSVPGRIRRC